MGIRRRNQYPRAGDLDTEVQIKNPTYSPDGQGGRTVSSWDVVATVWAEVNPVRGSRLSEYGVTISDKPREIKFRIPVWSGTPDYVIDEESILVLKDDSIDLHIQDMLDIDNLGMYYMFVTTERK